MRKKIINLLYMIIDCLPISRRIFNKQLNNIHDIFDGLQEYQMINRKDILTVTNNVTRFHSKELGLKNNKKKDENKPHDNMFG